jgi:hypothetical protein
LKRIFAIGVLVAALVGFLSGCGETDAQSDNTAGTGNDTAGSETSSTPPEPAEVFAAAVTKFNSQNAKYTIDDGSGDVGTGQFDSASGANSLTTTLDGSALEVVSLGDDVYLGGLLGDDSWMHAQASKFEGDGASFLMVIDPLFGARFLATATGVKQDQPSNFSGTIDLTKVTATGTTKRIADSFATAAGPGATAIPFTATLNGDTLASLTVTFPKADLTGEDLPYNLTITDSGGAVSVAAPPQDKVTEAPAELYEGP